MLEHRSWIQQETPNQAMTCYPAAWPASVTYTRPSPAIRNLPPSADMLQYNSYHSTEHELGSKTCHAKSFHNSAPSLSNQLLDKHRQFGMTSAFKWIPQTQLPHHVYTTTIIWPDYTLIITAYKSQPPTNPEVTRPPPPCYLYPSLHPTNHLRTEVTRTDL